MYKLRFTFIILILFMLLTGCGKAAPSETETAPDTETEAAAAVPAENAAEGGNILQLTVGENTIHAILEDNPTAAEIKELLKRGPISMEASNYGGFEKVCSLGKSLTSNDVQTATQPGDIMLYNSDKIVIFYGSNSWAYTALAKVAGDEIPMLEKILSGSETEVIIALG